MIYDTLHHIRIILKTKQTEHKYKIEGKEKEQYSIYAPTLRVYINVYYRQVYMF